MNRDEPRFSSLFLFLFAAFLSCLIVSNVIAGKLISVFGLTLPAAVVLFPLTYVLADIFTEVYGFKRARLVIWAGFGANLFMCLIFALIIALPSPSFYKGGAAYALVLGNTPRMVAASLLGYWCGEFANSSVLSVLKRVTKGKHLWTRTIGSTVVGQAFDTALFIGLGFWGIMPLGALLGMMAAQYLFKVAYEALCTPLTYAAVNAVKRRENIDVYDTGVASNPFGA
jgi:uncharacterized integral membrane protein (TIGR00697 family)